MDKHKSYQQLGILALALLAGVMCSWLHLPMVDKTANVVATLFIKFLQLLSMPIIFLAITSTLLSMDGLTDLRWLGKKVVKYTLSTTLIAAFIAFLLFNIIQPAKQLAASSAQAAIQASKTPSYLDTLLGMMPDNLVRAFSDNNVIGVALIAALFGLAMLTLEAKDRKPVSDVFASAFKGFLQLASVLVKALPVAVWAFTIQLLDEVQAGSMQLSTLGQFVLCVVLANVIQAVVVLPLMLKLKGLSVREVFSAVSPALITAFVSKSSSAALPLSMKCIESNQLASRKVTRFSLPLCTVINMNGCAAFIFISVLFVSMSNGMSFGVADMLIWVVLATIAAVGNASVPMGCYFLASAFLVGMGQPLDLMTLILPIYALIDMLETALNVWSDCVVTAAVGQDVVREGQSQYIDADALPS